MENKDAQWLKGRLEKHKNGTRPGMTLNLTTRQAQELVNYIEDLEFMRGIAIDVLAYLQSHMTPPWFMRQAFGDALAFEHHNQSKAKEADERNTDDG